MAAKCDVIEQLRQRVAELEGRPVPLTEWAQMEKERDEYRGRCMVYAIAEESMKNAQANVLAKLNGAENQLVIFHDAMSKENAQLQKQLAASQLENKRLRSALAYVIDDLELRASLKLDEDERGVVDIGNGAYTQAKEALREPTDTEALETYVMERLGEPVAEIADSWHIFYVGSYSIKHFVGKHGLKIGSKLYALKEPK